MSGFKDLNKIDGQQGGTTTGMGTGRQDENRRDQKQNQNNRDATLNGQKGGMSPQPGNKNRSIDDLDPRPPINE